jgi:hypothetical protein
MLARSAIIRRLTTVAATAALLIGMSAVVASPASAQQIVRQTTTRGCEWTTGVGQYWRVKAEVTVAQIAGTSTRWIESATNARTELTGFTFGVHESNSAASANIQGGGASVVISGAAVLNYGVPTPFGTIVWNSQPISCSTTYSVY